MSMSSNPQRPPHPYDDDDSSSTTDMSTTASSPPSGPPPPPSMQPPPHRNGADELERPKRRMVKSRLYSSPARRSVTDNPPPPPTPPNNGDNAPHPPQPKPRKPSPYREGGNAMAVPSRYRQPSPVSSRHIASSPAIKQASPSASSVKRSASAGRASAKALAIPAAAAVETNSMLISKRRSSSIYYLGPTTTKRSVDLMAGTMKNMHAQIPEEEASADKKNLSRVAKLASMRTPVSASVKPDDSKAEKVRAVQKGHTSNSVHAQKINLSTRKNSESCMLGGVNGGGEAAAVVYDKKWTDGSVSWSSLSPALETLGKETMQIRDAASQIASQALQEASSAESVIRSLSMFAELRSMSKPEHPEATVEPFLRFYYTLRQAVATSEALALEAANRSMKSQGGGGKENRKHDFFVEKAQKSAAEWVHAALSTDLASLSTLIDNKQLPLLPSIPTRVQLAELDLLTPPPAKLQQQLIESSPSAAIGGAAPWPAARRRSLLPTAILSSPNKGSSGRASGSQLSSDKRKTSEEARMASSSPLRNSRRNSMVAPPSANPKSSIKALEAKLVLVEESKEGGRGMEKTVRLGKQLQGEAEKWFLWYMDEAIDRGFQFSRSSSHNNDDDDDTRMLTQMKKVNEWLHEVVGGYKERKKGTGGGDSQTRESMDSLRRKIYEFLVHRATSAATEEGESAAESLPVRTNATTLEIAN